MVRNLLPEWTIHIMYSGEYCSWDKHIHCQKRDEIDPEGKQIKWDANEWEIDLIKSLCNHDNS